MPPKNRNNLSDILLDVFASGSAAAVSKTVVAPVERLKLFYQVKNKKFPNFAYFSRVLDYFFKKLTARD